MLSYLYHVMQLPFIISQISPESIGSHACFISWQSATRLVVSLSILFSLVV